MKNPILLIMTIIIFASCGGENYPKTFNYHTYTSPVYESYVITNTGLTEIELPDNFETLLFVDFELEVENLFGDLEITIESENEITFSSGNSSSTETYTNQSGFIIPETSERCEYSEGDSELKFWTWSEGNISSGSPRFDFYFTVEEEEIENWKTRLETEGSEGDTIYGYKSFIVFKE